MTVGSDYDPESVRLALSHIAETERATAPLATEIAEAQRAFERITAPAAAAQRALEQVTAPAAAAERLFEQVTAPLAGLNKQFGLDLAPLASINEQLIGFRRAMEPGLGISNQLAGFSRAMEPGLGISKQLTVFNRPLVFRDLFPAIPKIRFNPEWQQLWDYIDAAKSFDASSPVVPLPRCLVRTDRPTRRIRHESPPTRASLRHRRFSRRVAAPISGARCRADGLGERMKTTWYFDNKVRPKRPEIDPAWCADVIASPLHTEVQADGRIRFWGAVVLRGEDEPRIMRVVTLADGETVHNAFLDRDFRRAGTP